VVSLRFIHTADVHTDSPLIGITRHEEAAAKRIRSTTSEALNNLIGQAIDEQVAFVVMAGDLYEGDWRDFHTGLFFSLKMGRLPKAGIRAFILYGGHDAESQITERLSLPDNVTAFSTRKAKTFVLDDFKVALHSRASGSAMSPTTLCLATTPAVGIAPRHCGEVGKVRTFTASLGPSGNPGQWGGDNHGESIAATCAFDEACQSPADRCIR
jgi:hypothetical protein